MIIYDKAAAAAIEHSYQTPDIQRQRLHTLDALALQSGESVLDIGCGTALLSAQMAGLVGDKGRVVGIDNSEDMLHLARQRCADMTNVVFHHASACALPVAQETFDALSCTQTLLYVEDLSAALQQSIDALRPGGRAVFVETDWRGLVVNSAYDDITQRIIEAWPGAVPNANLPPRLRGLLRQQGFDNISVQAIAIVNTSSEDSSFTTESVRWLSGLALQLGAISDEERQRWLADLWQKGATGDYFCSINRFLFRAYK